MLQGDYLTRAINGEYLKKIQVFGMKSRVLSKQWSIHVSHWKKMANVYITLRSQVADELGIVAIWCFIFSSSCKLHIKTGDIC
jgi:hypothetical protein